MKKTNKKGFTLVEIMIVVAIIGLLAAIGIPSFSKARASSQEKSCINNMRVIDGAVDQALIENDGTAYTAYIKGDVPTCPIGETAYSVDETGAVSTTCGAGAGHVLPNAVVAADG